MIRKAFSGIMLALMLIGATLIFGIHPAMASGIVYIRANGSVDPPTAPISSIDGITYTLTDNVYGSIVVERSNIVLDGAGYTVQGSPGYDPGVKLRNRTNATIQNMRIQGFNWDGIGVYLPSGNNTIKGNIITNNYHGMALYGSRNNTIIGNNISANIWNGIEIYSWDNTITENNIENNYRGIVFGFGSGNCIYSNNFVGNSQQAYTSELYSNAWDNGYPTGGNYWSDYSTRYPDAQELDDSGIWDVPYALDESNQDNYPLMEPWTPTSPTIMASLNIDPDIWNFGSKGKWTIAYIQLPEGYDASDIDATAIRLNGTNAPVLDSKYDFVTNASEYLVDHNGDGILERMVKFDRASIASWIYQSVGMQHEVSLTIAGELTDGTPFEGTDPISVVCPCGGGGRRK